MIEIKQVGNQWRIKREELNAPAYRDIDKVYLQIFRGRMNEHGVINCANLYIYVDGHNPVDDKHIRSFKTGATHLNLVVPNGEFYNSMYTVKDVVFGNNY
jgi:hypothetical protein